MKILKIAIPVALVVIVAGVAAWWFLFRPEAEEEASLDAVRTDPAEESEANGDASGATLDGTWIVERGENVFVGYRVDETFVRNAVDFTATGRTTEVDGDFQIVDGVVGQGTVSAELATLETDNPNRDSRARQELATEEFPFATFVLTEQIDLSGATIGEALTRDAIGELTIKGTTQPATFALDGVWEGDVIAFAGSADIVLSDYGIDVSTFGDVASVRNEAVIEMQLRFVPR